MNNIVSLIPSYNPHNPYVEIVYNELKKVGDVILFTTETPSFECEHYIFDKSILGNLVYEPRKWIVENLDKDWEWVIYNEDDIFIPTKSIENIIDIYNQIYHKKMIPGFIRYEELNDKKYWMDMHPAHSIHRGGRGSIKQKFENLKMFEPWNIHSGNWIFNKREIQEMISNNEFETYHRQYGKSYFLHMESAASLPYLRYTKIIPYNLEKVECHHLPNKYVKLTPQVENLNI
jgi:hypothetical protein